MGKNKSEEQYRSKKFSRGMQKKLVVLFAAVIVIFLCLVGRITYINAESGAAYEKKVLEQQNYSSRIIPYRRGDIEDRNGTILATSERVYNVILDAKVLLSDEENVEPTKAALLKVFGISSEDVGEVLDKTPNSRYTILLKNVSYNTAQTWTALESDSTEGADISGVWLEENYMRAYPYSTLASDLIGFTTSGNVGNWGIEQYYNDELNGTNGREYGYLDGESSLERTVKQAVDGNTVVSTIDANLQSIVEEHILAFNEQYKNSYREGNGSNNTGVIIMDPNSGEVLAMASYPNYDLNNPRDLTSYYTQDEINNMSDESKLTALQSIWRNFCVNDTYEPGSTTKVFTMAAGFETGAITGDETYYCSGALDVADYTIHCHLRTGHGTLDLRGAIANSCNVALMEIAQSIGVDNFCKYQRVFGFGEYTGIDLPGEPDTSGLLYNADNMGAADLATNSFGQNFNVTMIQMAAAYCSLINGGNYYTPHVVKEIKSSDGNTVELIKPVVTKDTVSEQTSETLNSYMLTTVESGTAKSAQVAGYEVAGKTGTAEKLPRNNGNYVISFAGYSPSEKPEVMIYVVIDCPNADNQENTSLVTSLSAEIMADAFPYLNITTTDELASQESSETTLSVENLGQ